MNKYHYDNLYRAAGVIGLAALLILTLWQQHNRKSNNHDHSVPAQHNQEIRSAPLRDTKGLVPSGFLKEGIRVVDYDAYQYRFVPDPLIVYTGETVELRVKSNDVKHGLMIPEINFSTDIPIGKRKKVTFKAPEKTGEYQIFCSVFCGSDHGDMTGKLIVISSAQSKGETQHEQTH